MPLTTTWPRIRRLPTLDEIGVRGRQMIAARAERTFHGMGAALPSDRAIYGTRRHRGPSFFGAMPDRESDVVSTLMSRLGRSETDALVAAADRIADGHFSLLGHADLGFGDPVDFHLEPAAGKRAPLAHWSRIDYLNPEVAGDHKIIWELNRHQWFVTLGRAWWLTSDEKYARCFTHSLAAWIDQNPPKLGINWASSLELALRAIAWTWALALFREYRGLSGDLLAAARKVLYLHGRHIETYLSTYFSPNTHLTGEALGLVYLGTAFPEFSRAARWRASGTRIMLDMLDRHVRPDGVYFEQSSYYHRYTTDFYTHLYLLTRDSDPSAAEAVRPRLLALLDHLQAIARPDGTTPFVGDDDGGRLLVLDERPANDFRAALSTGAVLFDRADFKRTAGELAQETLWLLGPWEAARFDAPPPSEPAYGSRAFPDGGYFVMRDGWTRESNYLLADCGPHGSLSCGHSHADALAIEVAVCGRPALIDPGTFTYTTSAELRDRFRSTPAHNTVTVDGQSSSEPAGPFAWRHVARCSLRTWISQRRFDFFDGRHDGYCRLSDPVTHQRTILFLKGEYWVVRDRLVAAGAHRYEVGFHFPAGARPELTSVDGVDVVSTRLEAASGNGTAGPGLDIWALAASGRWEIRDDFVSPCYGRRDTAAVAVFSVYGSGQTDILTILGQRDGTGFKWATRAPQEVAGRCLAVEAPDTVDLLLIDAGSATVPIGVRSDFEWMWTRLGRDDSRMLEFVGIAGRSFDLGGFLGFRADRAVEWVTAGWRGSELLVDFTPAVSAEVTLAESISRLVVNGRPADRQEDQASRVTVRRLRPRDPEDDVRH
jgi:hypothetical protein